MTVLVGAASDNYIEYDVFDIAKEHFIELNSDITDYYVEDNTAVQDNIALKPFTITVSGYMGELVSKTNVPFTFGLNSIMNVNIQSLAQKMDVLNVLSPVMPTQIRQARQKISQLADKADLYRSIIATDINIAKNAYGVAKKVISKGEKLLNSKSGIKEIALRGTITQEIYDKLQRQAAAFIKFYDLWTSKSLSVVITPWGQFPNMAIQTISARLSEDSEYISDFSVTFKKFNSAQSKYVKFDAQQFKSYITQCQRSEMAEIGKSTGKQQDESILYGLYHK